MLDASIASLMLLVMGLLPSLLTAASKRCGQACMLLACT
jgi:hypothetical protein